MEKYLVDQIPLKKVEKFNRRQFQFERTSAGSGRRRPCWMPCFLLIYSVGGLKAILHKYAFWQLEMTKLYYTRLNIISFKLYCIEPYVQVEMDVLGWSACGLQCIYFPKESGSQSRKRGNNKQITVTMVTDLKTPAPKPEEKHGGRRWGRWGGRTANKYSVCLGKHDYRSKQEKINTCSTWGAKFTTVRGKFHYHFGLSRSRVYSLFNLLNFRSVGAFLNLERSASTARYLLVAMTMFPFNRSKFLVFLFSVFVFGGQFDFFVAWRAVWLPAKFTMAWSQEQPHCRDSSHNWKTQV